MDKVIYFSNNTRNFDSTQAYFDFIDYAFSQTDYFMLVYVNYYGKGYSPKMKYYKKILQPYQIKTRTNPSWPGVLNTCCANTTYKVIFYKNNEKAKEILKTVSNISDWSRPHYPEDLAFFKGNQCWFYSVGHEKIAAIIHASDEDITFVHEKGLANKEKAYIPEEQYFSAYDEPLIEPNL